MSRIQHAFRGSAQRSNSWTTQGTFEAWEQEDGESPTKDDPNDGQSLLRCPGRWKQMWEIVDTSWHGHCRFEKDLKWKNVGQWIFIKFTDGRYLTNSHIDLNVAQCDNEELFLSSYLPLNKNSHVFFRDTSVWDNDFLWRSDAHFVTMLMAIISIFITSSQPLICMEYTIPDVSFTREMICILVLCCTSLFNLLILHNYFDP